MTQRHSHSSIATFRSCPLKYKFRYVDGLEPRDAASNAHHLVFGSAGHAGLEHIYLVQKHDQEINSRFSHSHDDPAVLSCTQGIFATAYPAQLDPTDRAKTQENGVLMLAQYVHRWREEDRNWRVLSVETLDLESETGLDALKLDLVVENIEHGGIYGVDHKITGKALGPWFWDRFNPNSQITSYIDHVQEKYGSCEGFIINGISLQWLDEKKSNDANNVKWFSLDDPARPWLAYSRYEERPYRGGPLGKAGPRMCAWGLTVAFERMMFNRSRDQVRQERESTRYWIDRMEGAERVLASSGKSGFQGFAPYGFNTDACYSCEYRGGDVIGGVCRPGYEWPKDQELILLSYRQVCREVIQVTCPSCGGNGISTKSRERVLFLLTNEAEWQSIKPNDPIFFLKCERCKGGGTVAGPRCALDRGHAGAHAPIVAQVDEAIDVEVTTDA